MSVLLETSFGDLVIDLNTEKCPNACFNFLKLCKLKHYNNSLFIKVQKDYLAQVRTKIPTTIWNERGEKKPYFNDEVNLEGKVNELGLVATANAGSNKNNSEFFITLTKAHLSSLNGKHTVFGKVQEGLEVLKKINETYVDEINRPKMNIRILHTFILDDPFEDPSPLQPPPSPELRRQDDRLEAIEHLQMIQKYKTEKQVVEETKKQKAKTQAVTLELVGELPDANVKPPENKLFICKLNPITQERDLEIIFSRFGPIKSVQIVRDYLTGQSLQYGFIQFESEKSCEEAYLKMENVMIDDRRIHVDFCQSVEKLMPKRKKNIQKTKKSGESREKIKELVPKIKDGKNFYGQTGYDYVRKEAKQPYFKRDLEEIKQQRYRQRKQKKHRIRSGSEEERSASRSRSERKHKKKHKKHKKHKYDRYDD